MVDLLCKSVCGCWMGGGTRTPPVMEPVPGSQVTRVTSRLTPSVKCGHCGYTLPQLGNMKRHENTKGIVDTGIKN